MKFNEFLRDVCPPLDLNWRKYRRRSARHRVDARLAELGLHDYDAYLEFVRGHPSEAVLLADTMRVTITRFFREKRAWDELRERILPAIIEGRAGKGTVRIWSAGCCGGEEPYSIALLWLHYLAPYHPGTSLQVFATDIDAESLQRAARAAYGHQSLREVPADLRERWFTRIDDHWRLHDQPRSLVVFRQSNLMVDPPPQAMDLVLCRYLPFTYYHGDRLGEAARRLSEPLGPAGILMVGAKEILEPPALRYFEPLPESRFFYRRRETARRRGEALAPCP